VIYSNIADWRAYALARGDNAPTGASDVDATASLQRASDYIRTRYVIRLGLEATDANVIEATHIAAGYDIAAPGFWAKTFTAASAKVLIGVGDIKWQIVGGVTGADAQLPTSPAIDALFIGARAYGGRIFVV